MHHRTGLRHESQLSKDSVINLSQLVALNKNFLIDRVGRIPPARIRESKMGCGCVVPVTRKAGTPPAGMQDPYAICNNS